MKASKKPIVIDYLPYEGDILQIEMWVDSLGDSFSDHFVNEGVENLKVKTLEGTSYRIGQDDMIMRGIQGEYYPCKKDIFEQTYNKL